MILRPAEHTDLDALVDVQESGAVIALSHIFPQDLYPFPRDELRDRWATEIDNPEVHTYVVTTDGGEIVGFAATRGDELLHFGTAVATWRTGLATQAHDALIATFDHRGAGPTLWLRVFEDNHRARRFYEKLGWKPTEERSTTRFEPHPVLLTYRLSLRR